MKKIITDFKTRGGKHCITTALKQVFEYYNYPLSEEMLFGIGAGLSFVSINLDKSPMISGRTKPVQFEKTLAERLGVEISCKTSNNYKTAFDKTLKLLDANKPVLAYVDMPYLDYLNLGKDNHFGGHAIVLFGYDNDTEKFYISDRDNSDNPIQTPKGLISQDYHLVDYKQVELARSSNHHPFPANNKYFDINLANAQPITSAIIWQAIAETCCTMLNAPAQLLGVNGINKFSKEIRKWCLFDDKKLKIAGITNYFQINADGGTGGGIFRKMYGAFLIEASTIANCPELKKLGTDYIAKKWDTIADIMWQLFKTANRQLLQQMSTMIQEIYTEETAVLTELSQKIPTL